MHEFTTCIYMKKKNIIKFLHNPPFFLFVCNQKYSDCYVSYVSEIGFSDIWNQPDIAFLHLLLIFFLPYFMIFQSFAVPLCYLKNHQTCQKFGKKPVLNQFSADTKIRFWVPNPPLEGTRYMHY